MATKSEPAAPERRKSTCRRDWNDAIRDESGRISMTKVGTASAQIMAFYYLAVHWEPLLKSAELLLVVFLILTAPEMLKRLMNLKYGGGTDKK